MEIPGFITALKAVINDNPVIIAIHSVLFYPAEPPTQQIPIQ